MGQYGTREICYVENINSTNFFFGTNTNSTNLRIHELVIFSKTTILFIYQLRIGTKSAFEFPNYRSEQISVISLNFKIKKNI
jgi:hypothetical protein